MDREKNLQVAESERDDYSVGSGTRKNSVTFRSLKTGASTHQEIRYPAGMAEEMKADALPRSCSLVTMASRRIIVLQKIDWK